MKRLLFSAVFLGLLVVIITGFYKLPRNTDLNYDVNSVSKTLISTNKVNEEHNKLDSQTTDSIESVVLSENKQNQYTTTLKCSDIASKQMSFGDYLKILEKNPKFCGSTALPNSVLICLKGKAQNKIEPSCTQAFLNYLSTLIKDFKLQPVSELNDLILKAQVASALFSEQGIKKEEFDPVLPSLYELLRRHPENLGLSRTFVMLKAGIYLNNPLSDQDRVILDQAFSQDTLNSSTRKGIVTIFTKQKDGLKKIVELTQLYPQDLFPYVTIINESLIDGDKTSAQGWAEYALKQNPNNPDFKELRDQVFKGQFDVAKHKRYYIDISGAFEELLQ